MVGFFLFLLAGGIAAAQQQVVNMPVLLQRIENAALQNRQHYRPYVITREYRLYGSDEDRPKSEVTAEINFVPPKHQDYKILQTQGNSRGETIVRHLLEDQTKAAETGRAPGAVTRENYDFRYLGQENLGGHACYVLQLMPKREDKSLIDGRAWVDESTYLVRRIDGEMSKLPSWWLKSVHVTLNFDDFDGMWLQQNTRAVADVRIFGKHTFTARALSVQTGDQEAFNVSRRNAPARRKLGRPDAVLGTVVQH